MIAYEDKDFIIGTIPIIVAKCGAYLKDQGMYLWYMAYMQIINLKLRMM